MSPITLLNHYKGMSVKNAVLFAVIHCCRGIRIPEIIATGSTVIGDKKRDDKQEGVRSGATAGTHKV